jgi:hypothetical protein
MHAKIRGHREHQIIEQDLNGIELLRIIKLMCFNVEDERCIPQKAHETKAAFCHLKQGKDSDQACQIKFMNTVQANEQCGASLGEDPMTRAVVCENLGRSFRTTTNTEVAEITKTVRDCTPGVALILGADPERHTYMIRGLKNASLAGRDEWPKNVTEACNYLSKWEGDEPSNHKSRDYEGSSFLNEKEYQEPKERISKGPLPWHVKMTCRNCDKKGHIAAFCGDDKTKSAEQTADANVQEGQVDGEAAQQPLHGSQLADEN